MTPAARARRQVRFPIFLISAAAWVPLLSNAHFHSTLIHMALMTVAMMLPVVTPPVTHIYGRSFACRRRRAVFLFLSAYSGVWTLAGCVLLPAASIMPATVAGGLAMLWQCSPLKQRCLNRGHYHPAVPAFGVAADLAMLRFGVTHAIWCVGSCWALMLLALAIPAIRLELMAGAALWMFMERVEPRRTPSWRPVVPVKVARSALFFASRPLTAIGSL